MQELTADQKVCVAVGRWKLLRPIQITSLLFPTSNGAQFPVVLECYRSDECLNRVAAFQSAFGFYGN